MDLPVMKYLAESMRNTADALLETMRDGKTFVCDECFGGNFETCEANEPNAIRMVAGGNAHVWNVNTKTLLQTMSPISEEKPRKWFDQETTTLAGGTIQTVKFGGDGRRLFTAGYGYPPRVWDVNSGKVLKIFRGQGCS